MTTVKRALKFTAETALVGALAGTLVGAASLLIMTAVSQPSKLSVQGAFLMLFFASYVGVPVGAVVAPPVRWLLVADRPLASTAALTSIGALVGSLGLLALGAWTWDVSGGIGIPVMIVGGILGLLVSAFWLSRRKRIAFKP